jgi:hypothetical protein
MEKYFAGGSANVSEVGETSILFCHCPAEFET